MTTTPAASDRNRWMALYVLCAGMLMIVLDATIVNVALPSIQDDLGFSQSDLAWVVNAYLIAFGGLLLLAGRIGDLIGQRRIFLDRPRRLHHRLARLRARAEPGDADRRPLRPGRRRRADLRRDPRDDRHDVPRAARAGEGDRRLRVRRLRRRLDRAARRRGADRGDLLALDLLHQPARRRRHRARGAAADRRPAGHRAAGRRRPPGRGAPHGRAHARRVHHPRRRRGGLGVGPDARASAPSRSPCSRRSSRARRGSPTR